MTAGSLAIAAICGRGKGGDAALEWVSSGRLFTVLSMHWFISPGNKL